ncbi:MAG: glycosyltransferase [Nitrospiraceae bacterium]|nr:glycosyltransferase [Nitrospiraceae bacterium]
MNVAPIALFTYKRPVHTLQAIDSLRKNELSEKSELFIFSDGWKGESDREKVLAVRERVRKAAGFRRVTIIERDWNYGLARSIVSGVNEVVGKFGRVIVLEDDMVTSPFFLQFMNDALDLYENEEKVISVHGYIYPVKGKLPETFFLRGADCWGWATWKRGWELFEPDGAKLFWELKNRGLEEMFNFSGAFPYMSMLEDQIKGKNDSWAIRWHASAFLGGRLTLYPGRSLICNIGTDRSGTHCGSTRVFDTKITADPVRVSPIPIEENTVGLQEIKKYFEGTKKSAWSRLSLVSRAVDFLGKRW